MRHAVLLWRQRALVAVLVRRDLSARYRASVLGFFWSLLNPLLLYVKGNHLGAGQNQKIVAFQKPSYAMIEKGALHLRQ